MHKITKYSRWNILICFAWLAFCGHLVLADPVLDTVIEGIKFNDSLLKDVNAKYRLKQNFKPEFFSGPPIVERENGTKMVKDQRAYRIIIAEWAIKGNKVRLKYTTSASNEAQGNYEVLKEETVIFDGSKSSILAMGYPGWRGMIKAGNETNVIRTPLYFGYYCRGKVLSEILTESQVTLRGKEEISSTECYVIEIRTPEGYKSVLWIDPACGFRTRKLEDYASDGLLVVRLDSVTLNKHGDIWFPSSGRLHGVPKKKADGTSILSVETELVIDDVQINKGLPDSLFEMVWPSGARVYDYILRMGYNVP